MNVFEIAQADPKTFIGQVVTIAFLTVIMLEGLSGRLNKSITAGRDMFMMGCGILMHVLFTGATITAIVALQAKAFPDSLDALAYVSIWLTLPVVILLNELGHYGVHRLAHSWRKLWPLHRTHHTATQMNSAVLFRYGVAWVLILPQVLLGMISLHMGLAAEYAIAAGIGFAANLSTHTAFRWDLALLKIPGFKYPWAVYRQLITTPAHHWHHHSYKGANSNYAVTLIFLDKIFGSYAEPDNYPKTPIGLPCSGRVPLRTELLYPLFRDPIQKRQSMNNP
ncbi:MAG: sterol desaturase family protein [Pseudomonadales bacterium]|nr:sterol desaturase family protein [Pseudomonadales bacterium]